MKWVRRVVFALLSIVVLLTLAGGVGYWYLTRHGGTDVRQDGLVGRFYTAPGMHHRTAVLMLGGSNGGYPYDRAAQNLAAAGYPVFALAYFKSVMTRQPSGLPDHLADIPLEYFFHAIDWMKRRPEVDPERIALMGESRGGELVLLLASLRPDVAGVIAYSPSSVVWAGLDPTNRKPAWTLGEKPLPYLVNATYTPKTALASFENVLAGTPPEERAAVAIRVENIRGPVLLISSRSDNLWPSSQMADAVAARLKEHDFIYPVENIQYTDASHLLMGFGPGITKIGFPPDWGFYFGGSAKGTHQARDAGWATAKAFLARIAAEER